MTSCYLVKMMSFCSQMGEGVKKGQKNAAQLALYFTLHKGLRVSYELKILRIFRGVAKIVHTMIGVSAKIVQNRTRREGDQKP